MTDFICVMGCKYYEFSLKHNRFVHLVR